MTMYTTTQKAEEDWKQCHWCLLCLTICKLKMASIRPRNAKFQATDAIEPPFHIIAKTHPVYSATISQSLSQKSSRLLPLDFGSKVVIQIDTVLWIERQSSSIQEQKVISKLEIWEFQATPKSMSQCRKQRRLLFLAATKLCSWWPNDDHRQKRNTSGV